MRKRLKYDETKFQQKWLLVRERRRRWVDGMARAKLSILWETISRMKSNIESTSATATARKSKSHEMSSSLLLLQVSPCYTILEKLHKIFMFEFPVHIVNHFPCSSNTADIGRHSRLVSGSNLIRPNNSTLVVIAYTILAYLAEVNGKLFP